MMGHDRSPMAGNGNLARNSQALTAAAGQMAFLPRSARLAGFTVCRHTAHPGSLRAPCRQCHLPAPRDAILEKCGLATYPAEFLVKGSPSHRNFARPSVQLLALPKDDAGLRGSIGRKQECSAELRGDVWQKLWRSAELRGGVWPKKCCSAEPRGGVRPKKCCSAELRGCVRPKKWCSAELRGGARQKRCWSAEPRGGDRQKECCAAELRGGVRQKKCCAAEPRGGDRQKECCAAELRGGVRQKKCCSAELRSGKSSSQTPTGATSSSWPTDSSPRSTCASRHSPVPCSIPSPNFVSPTESPQNRRDAQVPVWDFRALECRSKNWLSPGNYPAAWEISAEAKRMKVDELCPFGIFRTCRGRQLSRITVRRTLTAQFGSHRFVLRRVLRGQQDAFITTKGPKSTKMRTAPDSSSSCLCEICELCGKNGGSLPPRTQGAQRDRKVTVPVDGPQLGPHRAVSGRPC